MTRYLYVAQACSDARLKKHHVYKVGYSTQPLERVHTLGGSGSTESYEIILVLELPSALKDSHVLAHRRLDPFVVHRHEDLQSKYTALFGSGHNNGVRRRREIVMFGQQYTLSRVKSLFRRIVSNMRSPTGTYQCHDGTCLATGGVAYCDVCSKYMKSLVNSMTYQSGVSSQISGRKRTLEDMDTLFTTMIEQAREHKKQRWHGPTIGDFWVLRPTVNLLKSGCRFLVARVQSLNKSKRTSRVQWWSCSTDDDMDVKAKFTPDVETDTLSWDGGGWQCHIRMKQYTRFMRIVDTDTVKYYARKWRVNVQQLA
jgi:hypothetical protein